MAGLNNQAEAKVVLIDNKLVCFFWDSQDGLGHIFSQILFFELEKHHKDHPLFFQRLHAPIERCIIGQTGLCCGHVPPACSMQQ